MTDGGRAVTPRTDRALSGIGSRAALWIVVVSLVAFFSNFNPFASDAELYSRFGSGEAGSPVATIFGYLRYAMLAIATAGLVYFLSLRRTDRRRRRTVAVLLGSYWLFGWAAFLVKVIASPWSTSVMQIQGIVQLLTLSAAVFIVGLLGDGQRIMRAFFYALTACLIISYIGLAVIPDRAIHTFASYDVSLNENLQGLWRGMFGHKNIAGGFFMELLVMSVPLAFAGEKRVLIGAAAVGAAIFLYFAGSVSSVFAPAVAIVVVIAALKIPGVALVLPEVFASLYIAFPFIVALYLYQFGVSLDNRDIIWQTAFSYIKHHELLGRGFMNGFGTQTMEGYSNADWIKYIGHAHSGAVDMYIFFGVPGLILLWLMVRTVLRAYVRLFRQSRAGQAWWFNIAGFLVFVSAVVRSMVEPDVLTPRGGWLIMLLTGMLPVLELWRLQNSGVGYLATSTRRPVPVTGGAQAPLS